MKKKYILGTILPLLLLGGCASSPAENEEKPGENTPGDVIVDGGEGSGETEVVRMQNAKCKNYYQLLVYSFADSNNDGVGDFKGIVDKLDYLVNLGIEGIWLSPILECDSYHAYDVTDYYTINPKYETSSSYNYKYLLKECHKKGISVVMDLVLNHTSYNHKWYREHRDWYSDKDVFGGSMKDLDYSKTEVQNAIIDVGKYWLNEGFDGYRLDAAMWLYNKNYGTDASSVDHNMNYKFWTKWCNEMYKVKKDAYIIGEVLNSNHNLAYQYSKSGFDSTFDFNARTQIESVVTNSSYDYVAAYNADQAKITDNKDRFIMGRPLSNHDVGRFTCEHSGMGDEGAHYVTSKEDIRLANAINALTPGNTFVYYGDELGLYGYCSGGWDDMNYRTPMPFGSERTISQVYFEGFRGEGATTSRAISGKTAEQDAQDSSSLYSALSKILKLKKEHPAIQKGAMSKMTSLKTLKGFSLTYGNDKIYVVYNTTGSSKTYTLDSKSTLLVNSDNKTGSSLTIQNKGYIVYTK